MCSLRFPGGFWAENEKPPDRLLDLMATQLRIFIGAWTFTFIGMKLDANICLSCFPGYGWNNLGSSITGRSRPGSSQLLCRPRKASILTADLTTTQLKELDRLLELRTLAGCDFLRERPPPKSSEYSMRINSPSSSRKVESAASRSSSVVEQRNLRPGSPEPVTVLLFRGRRKLYLPDRGYDPVAQVRG
jgi:hypothetical protein